jgi:hypothetical protein
MVNTEELSNHSLSHILTDLAFKMMAIVKNYGENRENSKPEVLKRPTGTLIPEKIIEDLHQELKKQKDQV